VISIQPYALNGKGYWGDVPKMTELPKCPAHKGLKAPSPKVRKSPFDVSRSTIPRKYLVLMRYLSRTDFFYQAICETGGIVSYTTGYNDSL
jgi:hypothetical protein